LKPAGARPWQRAKTKKNDMNIQRGIIKSPQKITIYGPEGIGKSTLAAAFPEPLFIDTESSTKQLDVARITASCWEDVEKPFKVAATLKEFQTLVLDTADWAANFLQAKVCKDGKKNSIEDFGFGKGWVLLEEEFAKFLTLTTQAAAAGKTIVFLAHSHVKRHDAPEGSYDRYELKLHKRLSALLKEGSDAVLFASYKTSLVEGDNGKTKAIGGKERILYTQHSAAWDAKNRHGLPERIPMTIDAIAPLITSAPAAVKEPEAVAKIHPMDVLLSGKSASQKAKVTESAINRGWIQLGQSYRDLSPSIIERAQANPEKFFAAFGI